MRSIYLALCGVAACGLTSTLLAESPAPSYILRISTPALSSLHESAVECETQIEDEILGTTIKGTAKTAGKCSVVSSEENADLRIKIVGQSVSKTRGTNGPAIIHTTTTTDFTATAALLFDANDGFSAGEIEVDAELEIQTDDIQSTQKGIAGTVVRKLAAKKVAEARPESKKRARELAIVRIRSEIAVELEKRLTKLNTAFEELRPVLAILHRDGCDYVLRTGASELIICAKHAPEIVGSLPKAIGAAEILIVAGSIDAALGDKLAAGDKKSAIDRQAEWWIVRRE